MPNFLISVHIRYPRIYHPLLDSSTIWSQISQSGFDGQSTGLSCLDGFKSNRHKKSTCQNMSIFFVSNNHFRYHFLVTKKDRHTSKFSNISFASFDNDQSNLLLGKQGSILLSSIPSADLSLSIATRKSSQKLSILTTRFHKPMVSSFAI